MHQLLIIMELLDRIPVEFNPEEVLRNLQINTELAARLHVPDLFGSATSMIHPKALYTTAYITNRTEQVLDIEGITLSSRVLAKNLDRVQRIFPYIITIGNALENEASTCKNIMQGLCLERMGDLALSSARTYLEKCLVERYKLGRVSHMGPGQLDWPIAQQRELFSIFGDVETKIGVRLTDNFLMIPRKSISGIIFPTEVTFTSCQLCPRKDCISRQAPYSETLRRSYGLEPV